MAAALRSLLMVVVAFGLLVPLWSATARAGTPAPAVSVPDGGAAMLADERAATYAVNQFWTLHFQQYFGRPYRAPEVRGGYTSVGNAPPCGGVPAQSFNAFYCQSGDFIAWDQNLMSAGYQRIGNAWVYLIIAHEWGHSIQARVSDHLVSQADELQADCLGAAALTGAERDGTLRPEPTDAEQIAQTLAASADKYPWTSSRDHGNTQQRGIAFNLGTTQGVVACMRDIR